MTSLTARYSNYARNQSQVNVIDVKSVLCKLLINKDMNSTICVVQELPMKQTRTTHMPSAVKEGDSDTDLVRVAVNKTGAAVVDNSRRSDSRRHIEFPTIRFAIHNLASTTKLVEQ
jgi:hypothetical protein